MFEVKNLNRLKNKKKFYLKKVKVVLVSVKLKNCELTVLIF